MSFKVTVEPAGHEFSVEDGETILDAAVRKGFDLPYGCRSGACGACKGKIVQGEVDQGKYDKFALSDLEIAAGKTLFCCARPKSDLVIEGREIRGEKEIKPRTLPSRVQKMEMAAPDVMVLSLRLPASDRLQFFSGQYIDILFRDGKKRSFSLANAPHDDEFLQLHVRNIPGGAFTAYVFGEMKEKDIIRFEGPHGSFYLHEDSEKPIIFVASGTGFAPVKSIIEHAFHVGIKRKMILYWGANTLSDLYMKELPEQWAQSHENFSFVPVLSAARPEDAWEGRSGLVHQAVMADYSTLADFQVYACGAPVMVQAAHQDFTTQRHLPADEFFSDAFTYSAQSKT